MNIFKNIPGAFFCYVRDSTNATYFIIGIQPLGRFAQRPELSQATGIALVRCILGKLLGVGLQNYETGIYVCSFSFEDAI